MRRVFAAAAFALVLFGAAPAHAFRSELRDIEEIVDEVPEPPDGCIVSANIAGVRVCI